MVGVLLRILAEVRSAVRSAAWETPGFSGVQAAARVQVTPGHTGPLLASPPQTTHTASSAGLVPPPPL